jgi:hypothetical protein
MAQLLSVVGRGLSIALLTLCCACSATVKYERAKDADGSTGTGIRYYESAPYLLIYSDGKGGLKWQILYLPDQSHIMLATPVVHGGGKSQLTLSFQNGILGTSTVAGDTTAIPSAILAAAAAVIPVLVAGVLEGKKPEEFPAPYLYKIVVDADSVHFLGGQGDTNIRVPIPTGPAG